MRFLRYATKLSAYHPRIRTILILNESRSIDISVHSNFISGWSKQLQRGFKEEAFSMVFRGDMVDEAADRIRGSEQIGKEISPWKRSIEISLPIWWRWLCRCTLYRGVDRPRKNLLDRRKNRHSSNDAVRLPWLRHTPYVTNWPVPQKVLAFAS